MKNLVIFWERKEGTNEYFMRKRAKGSKMWNKEENGVRGRNSKDEKT